METYVQLPKQRPLGHESNTLSRSRQLKQIVDNRPEAIQQKSMLEIMNGNRVAIQCTLLERPDSNDVFSKSKESPMMSTNVSQLSKNDIDYKKFISFFMEIIKVASKIVSAEMKMPDKPTDELTKVLFAKSRIGIDRQSDEVLATLYAPGKAPKHKIMRKEIKKLFKTEFRKREQEIKKEIRVARIRQLQERQGEAKEISPLPEFKGEKKTVKIILADKIKKAVEWDVIWNKIMQEGFYPSHVEVNPLAPYTDDLKEGSHFRKNKKSAGNHFYELSISDDESVLTLTIHDYWETGHPCKGNPWKGVPEGTRYAKPITFSVTGDMSKRIEKLPKMQQGTKGDSQWGITEAQRLALEQQHMEAIDVPPDGFCLTSAVGISRGLDGAQLRTMIINRLSDYTADGEVNLRIIEAFGAVNDFVLALINPRGWAGAHGENIISGIALVLNINIHVINEDGTITPVITPGAEGDVYITRIGNGGGHFGATRNT